MADEIKKKRGRPPLNPDLKAQNVALRREKHAAYQREYAKRTGCAAQKKYRASHPEVYRGRHYEPKLRIPIEKKDVLMRLVAETGMSITQLFVEAVQEKYNVTLAPSVDNDDHL